MLNAFRHQRKKRPARHRGGHPDSRYAQRLPASKEETRSVVAGLRVCVARMLNVFRHQRKKRSPPVGTRPASTTYAQRLPASKEETLVIAGTDLEWAIKCSTPSGIKGRNANRWAPSSPSPPHAQRLPASKEETQTAPASVCFSAKCSTPSGIKGRNAGTNQESCSDLSAYAQRLPASKEETLELPLALANRPPYAQRLPASKEETLHRQREAVRRQEMLNAFRHQRKKRGSDRFCTPSTTSCSTPSGIKGRNAS